MPSAGDSGEPSVPPEDDHPTNLLQPYTVLTEAGIRWRQEKLIASVSFTLSLPTSSSTLLLCHHNWDADKLSGIWVDDESSTRTTVGLLEPCELSEPGEDVICPICFNSQNHALMSAAACGHYYCNNCWEGYIGTSVTEGPGCLALRCPDPSCPAAVDPTMVEKLTTIEDRAKYVRYLLRSYVESSKTFIKWCPSPGCEHAVEFEGSGEVQCLCLHSFCWSCTEEAHRPASCHTVAKWVEKARSGDENINWLLANSKTCPNCKRAIEKDQGCMHMKCTPPCNFEFCWLCLGDWKLHSDHTGGFFGCNQYKEAKTVGTYDEEEVRRRDARVSLGRYTHYYERWSSNHNSMMKALENVQGLKNEQRQLMMHIVQCRRMLKWSHAYGYFLPEQEGAKRRRLEKTVREAELGVERLYQTAEEELRDYIDKEAEAAAKGKLNELRNKASSQLDKLVIDLESGMDGVDSETDDHGNGSSLPVDLDHDINKIDHWYCVRCTFANRIGTTRCRMCVDPESDED